MVGMNHWYFHVFQSLQYLSVHLHLVRIPSVEAAGKGRNYAGFEIPRRVTKTIFSFGTNCDPSLY